MNLNLKNHQNDLLFLPLGGANEIGMNLNLYHLDGKWIMIDCGMGFAYDIPGVDMMTADISFIKANRKNLLGIIITHIHEAQGNNIAIKVSIKWCLRIIVKMYP